MRIAIVVPRYLPHLGGIENHVAAVASGLQKRGHQITVATQLEGDASLSRDERTDSGVAVRRFPSAGRLRGQGISPRLWHWVWQGAGQADIVHLHNFHALTTVPAVTAARQPFVLTPHYLGPGEGLAERALHGAYSAAMRRALRRVSRIICVTHSEAEEFARNVGFRERCRVIPNGVDVAAIRAALPAANRDGKLLVVAGRMEEYKQPQVALAALSHLPADYTLAVVGAGPLDDELRRQAQELGLTGRVLFLGRLPPTGVFSWYRAAEAIVALSRRECFGLTVAEGLAAGAAVVASDIGAHRDVASRAGAKSVRFVPASAPPRDVAAAIREACSSGAPRRQMRVPTWDDVVLEIEQVYLQEVSR